jgi:outer membrane protein TolC
MVHGWRLIAAAAAIAFTSAAAHAQQPAASDAAPLTLQAALALARSNSETFLAARSAAQLAVQDRKQARAALLPSISAVTQYIHTQPNGTPSGIWVPNDGPHVYDMYGTIHADVFAPGKWADYRAAAAAEAVARARAEVAARGLVSTVVQDFYMLVAAQRKAISAQQSLTEAQQFLDLTRRQEQGGEVAHADVVKAQIQAEQRQRDAQDATLVALKARLGLSVLIFPDFRDNVVVTDDLAADVPLPPIGAVRTAAQQNNPDVTAAQAAVRQQASAVTSARSAYLPSASFDYFYGIEANQFAVYDPEGHRLLGNVWQAQVAIPLWNWGATGSRLAQAHLREQQAQVELAFTQRELQGNLAAFYAEAQTAQAQVGSLRASLDLATESLRLTVLRYQAGEATVLEVVDAQSTLTQARNAYDDGLVRYRIALAALQTLTGTL